MALLDRYIKNKYRNVVEAPDDNPVTLAPKPAIVSTDTTPLTTSETEIKDAVTASGHTGGDYAPEPVVPDPVVPPAPDSTASGATSVQSYLKNTLEGKNPLVQNAQATQDTSTAVQKYLAGKTARNTSAQAGFDPGTLQYQRTQDRATAAADQSILAGQNEVNDLTRDISQQALADKSALDASAIASVTDPKAKNYLQQVLASGGDVQQALAGMYENGVLKDEYSSGTPAEQAKRAIEDQVEVLGFVRGTPEFDAEVMRRLNLSDEAENAPVETEVTEAQIKAVQDKARSGQVLSDEEELILLNNTDAVKNSALPSTKEQIEAAKSDDPFVKLEDGKVYQIQDYYQQTTVRNTGALSNRHKDWTVLKDVNTGKTFYVSSDGIMIDYKPPNPSDRANGVEYVDGVWVETYARSGGTTGKVYNPVTGKWVSK